MFIPTENRRTEVWRLRQRVSAIRSSRGQREHTQHLTAAHTETKLTSHALLT